MCGKLRITGPVGLILLLAWNPTERLGDTPEPANKNYGRMIISSYHSSNKYY